jgi:hypothetical protein
VIDIHGCSSFAGLTRLRLRPTRHVAWLRSPVHDELWWNTSLKDRSTV